MPAASTALGRPAATPTISLTTTHDCSHGWPEDGAIPISRRFRLTPAEVLSLLGSTLRVLRDRDRFLALPNGTELSAYPRLPIGTAKICWCQTEPGEAYAEFLREVDPDTIEHVEPEGDIRRHPTFDRYVAWWKAGHVAPPLSVFEEGNGSGRLLTTSRRRTLTARAAGIRSVLCWFGPLNHETGFPLKYGDVLRAAGRHVPSQ